MIKLGKTITALATPPGVSGMAVIRLSGEKSIEIIDKCFMGKTRIADCKSHTIHFGNIFHAGKLIDTVTVTVFKSPHSYTGEDVVEIGCHGGNVIYSLIIDALISLGAEIAEPGEFTRRAFINGKLDLAQVEAVADIIHSNSVPGAQTSARQLVGEFTCRMKNLRKSLMSAASLLELELDFADEGFEFVSKDSIIDQINDAINICRNLFSSFHSAEILREGFYVGIAGYPNSGKSTLFNSLLSKERAIVSHLPGTTRDYLEESLLINGIGVKLIDTAGIRESDDIIEIQGIALVESVLKQSDMILVINDASKGLHFSDNLFNELKAKYPNAHPLLIQNKIDLIDAKTDDYISISAKHKIGIEELKSNIGESASNSVNRVTDVLINQRHSKLLKQVSEILENSIFEIRNGKENELIAIDIREASAKLGDITGDNWNEEVLNNIFAAFCIGK